MRSSIKSLARTLDALHGFVVRRRGRIQAGSGSIARWRHLHPLRAGQIKIGQRSMVFCRIDFDSPNGQVLIGDRCYLGASQLVCHTSITIGNDVLMSWGVTVVDHDSHSLVWDERANDVANWMDGKKDWSNVKIAPVVICDKVWIGFGVSILEGVVIGEGAVVGAGSVVTRNVAPYTVVAGNPARVVRSRATGVSEA